jgi:hypothetical protein
VKITDLLWLFAEEEWGEHDIDTVWNECAGLAGCRPLGTRDIDACRVAMEQLRYMIIAGLFEDYRPNAHNPVPAKVYPEPEDVVTLRAAQGDISTHTGLTEIVIRRRKREAAP